MTKDFAYRFCIFILVLMMQSLNAKSYIISPLPTPRQEMLDIDADPCNENCLWDLYYSGKLFSFVAKFDSRIKDQDLRAKLAETLNTLGLFMRDNFFEKIQDSKKIRIALMVPKDIVGRYSAIGINTILAYLTSRDITFSFEVFDSKNEEAQNIRQTYEEIKQKKFNCIVAMLTTEGVENLLKESSISLPTYIPTVNRNQVDLASIPDKLFFGGIDYREQIGILASLAKDEEIVEYDDASAIGANLALLAQRENFHIISQETITNEKAARFSQEIKNQEKKLAGRSVLLNIPVIKTGLILPQISFLEDGPLMFLSTQINYNPSLLMLLKPKDRENFYIINSIGKTNSYLLEYGLLLGSDLQYDWVSYSIGIGTEMLFLKYADKVSKYFSEVLENSQVKYDSRIYKTLKNNFEEIKPEELLKNLQKQKELRLERLKMLEEQGEDGDSKEILHQEDDEGEEHEDGAYRPEDH